MPLRQPSVDGAPSAWSKLRAAKSHADETRLTEKVKALNDVLRDQEDIPTASSHDGQPRRGSVGWDGLANAAQKRREREQPTHINFLELAANPLGNLSFSAAHAPVEPPRQVMERNFTKRMRSRFDKGRCSIVGWETALQQGEFTKHLKMHISSRWGGGGESKRGWCSVIDPRKTRWVGYQDGASMIALIFTALVTPFEVAFVPPCGPTSGWLWWANRLVDIVFSFDIVLQFRMAYATVREGQGHVYEFDQKKIVWHYLRGWFVPDFFTTSLSLIDFTSMADSCGSASELAAECANGGGADGGAALWAQVKVLRVIRVVRLVKVVRILRASRLVARWETRVSINYAALALLRATLVVLLFLHWSACVWSLQVGFFGGGMHATYGGETRTRAAPRPPFAARAGFLTLLVTSTPAAAGGWARAATACPSAR